MVCASCQSNCNSCGNCSTPTCFNCAVLPCDNCVETVDDFKCVYLQETIQCNATSRYIIPAGSNLKNVIQQLLCILETQQSEINFLKTHPGSAGFCEIPLFAGATII